MKSKKAQQRLYIGSTLVSTFCAASAILLAPAVKAVAAEAVAEASGYPFSISEGYKSPAEQATDWVRREETGNYSFMTGKHYDPATVKLVDFDTNSLLGRFTVATTDGTQTSVVYARCAKTSLENILPNNKPLACGVSPFLFGTTPPVI